MTYPLYMSTLSSIPPFPCGHIPRITGGISFGGDPCNLTLLGLRKPTHVCGSVRRFPSPCLKFGATCSVPLYAGYISDGVCGRGDARRSRRNLRHCGPCIVYFFGPSVFGRYLTSQEVSTEQP